MTHALVGQWNQLGWVAAKAALLFTVAVIGLRAGARRTIAELSVFDFVTAVAVGAVVGRVPNSSSTSFLEGAVTLAVLLVMHRILSTARLRTGIGRVLDYQPLVLIRNGSVDRQALRRSQLTRDDLASMLRSRGVADFADVNIAILEPAGTVSVVNEGCHGDLVRSVASQGTPEDRQPRTTTHPGPTTAVGPDDSEPSDG